MATIMNRGIRVRLHGFCASNKHARRDVTMDGPFTSKYGVPRDQANHPLIFRMRSAGILANNPLFVEARPFEVGIPRNNTFRFRVSGSLRRETSACYGQRLSWSGFTYEYADEKALISSRIETENGIVHRNIALIMRYHIATQFLSSYNELRLVSITPMTLSRECRGMKCGKFNEILGTDPYFQLEPRCLEFRRMFWKHFKFSCLKVFSLPPLLPFLFRTLPSSSSPR